MKIIALDLAVRMGFAIGAAGERFEDSGATRLKKPSESAYVAGYNLIAWLQTAITTHRPDIVVKESPLPLQAFKDRGNSEAGVTMAYGLHMVAGSIAQGYGVRIESAHPATIRKHFIGRANLGSRAETKRAVIARCHLLKLMPRDRADEDEADAIALWDWAAATFGSVTPRELHMFNERAAG